MGKYLKIRKNLVVAMPEHNNLGRKTAIKTKFEFTRKKEHSLIADTKLQVDQSKRKWRQSSIAILFKKSNILKVKTSISFPAINQIK